MRFLLGAVTSLLSFSLKPLHSIGKQQSSVSPLLLQESSLSWQREMDGLLTVISEPF